MLREYNVLLYTTFKPQFPKNMTFVQHDSEGNRITFELYDNVDVPMTNIYEATATVERPDGKTYTYGVEEFIISGNKVTFILPPSAVYVDGKYNASISVYDTDYGRITTPTFSYDVTKQLVADTPIDETNEYPALTRFLQANANEDERIANEELRKTQETTRQSNEISREQTFDEIVQTYETATRDGVNVELVEARKGEVNLRAKIDSIDSSMADSLKQLGYNNGSYKYNGAVVTIIDDDAYLDFLTKWKPLADEKGIKISIGFISSNEPGNTSFMSLAQAKALQAEGHNLLNHSYGFVDTKTVTAEAWENECIKSKEFAIKHGFDATDTIIYGGGFWGTYDESQKSLVKNIARKYFKYAINSDGGANESVYDPMCVDRQPMDNRTLAQVQSVIDTANTNKTWLILYTHCGMYWQEQNIRDIIDYIKSLNIPILTYSQAEKIKGYDMFSGDYSDPNKAYILKNGVTNISKVITSMSTNIDLPITAYNKYEVTYQQVDYTKDTYFGKGGVLVTFRGDAWFSYQLFYLATDKTVLKRAWNETSQSWEPFYKIYNGASNKLSVGCSNIITVNDAVEIVRITNTTSASTIQYIQNSVEGKIVTILNRTSANNITLKQAPYMGTNDGSIFNKSGADKVITPLTSATYRNIENTWFEV